MKIDSEEFALALECKSEGDRGVAALLLQAARRRAQNRSLVERLMRDRGGAEGMELSNVPEGATQKEPAYVAILPEPDGSGKSRLVSFRQNGFHGHQVFATPEAALEEAVRDGYRWPVQVLDQLALQPLFQKGQRFVELVYAYNIGKLDAAAFHAAVDALDREYDLKEAA
ncbi:hypothetical protein [Methylobacillus sp.]|uniref:hypothetical protein n=1 Tax=Betaproteobacteria TaxID=28216 RepID=UPI002FE07402